MHEAAVHLFSDPFLCVGIQAMSEPEIKCTKDGMIISSNKCNLQGELMKKRFNSYSLYFLEERQTRSCSRSMSGFDKVKEKMDNILVQKTVIGFPSWED